MSNLSEENRKEAQRIAKNIADQLDALKYAFLQMGGVNITPHTDKPPKPLDHWMKANPVIVKTKRHGTLMTPEAAVQDAMMKPCPIQDELIDWLKEQRKNEIFKREYLGRWQSFSPSPLTEEDVRKMERVWQREQAAKKRAALENDPEAFGTFGYEFMGIDLGKGEENGND